MGSVRLLKRDDVAQVYEVIKVVWGEGVFERAKARWNWQYLQNPLTPPEGPQILVYDHDGIIGGLVCAFPARFRLGQTENALVFWVTDFMVIPEYRGKPGMRLATDIVHLNRFLMGFPLPEILRFWKRKKSKVGCRLVNYVRFCRLAPVVKQRSAKFAWAASIAGAVWFVVDRLVQWTLPRAKEMEFRPVNTFDAAFEDLWQELKVFYPCIQNRDQSFLDWRYTQSPHKKYSTIGAYRNGKLRGYVVYRAQEKNGLKWGYIIDAFASPQEPDVIYGLMAEANRTLHAMNVDLISAIFVSPHAVYTNALKRCGLIFTKKGSQGMYKNNVGLPIDANLMKEDWFITRADADLDMT